jgi:hypothetical protein
MAERTEGSVPVRSRAGDRPGIHQSSDRPTLPDLRGAVVECNRVSVDRTKCAGGLEDSTRMTTDSASATEQRQRDKATEYESRTTGAA